MKKTECGCRGLDRAFNPPTMTGARILPYLIIVDMKLGYLWALK